MAGAEGVPGSLRYPGLPVMRSKASYGLLGVADSLCHRPPPFMGCALVLEDQPLLEADFRLTEFKYGV